MKRAKLLAPFVEGAWAVSRPGGRGSTGLFLYLRDSREGAGSSLTLRCAAGTLDALFGLGVLVEDQHAGGGIRDCSSKRPESAGPAADLAKAPPEVRARVVGRRRA